MASDAGDAVKRGLARVLGRGDRRRTELVGERLDQARLQITVVAGAELEQARERLVAVWQARLEDALEETPEIAGDLRALIEQARDLQPGAAASGSGHGVAAARDVRITASGGGVAAGTIHGSVTAGNPTHPGTA